MYFLISCRNFWGRNNDVEACASLVTRTHRQLSVEATHPFLYAQKTEGVHLLGPGNFHSYAIVADSHRKVARCQPQPNLYLASLCVTDDIGQRFLIDSKDGN